MTVEAHWFEVYLERPSNAVVRPMILKMNFNFNFKDMLRPEDPSI
jgi:hypothetical protein